jgi:hypothetical protein
MSSHFTCVDVRRTEYLSLFLQLRQPATPTLPVFVKWRDLLLQIVGDVRAVARETRDGKIFKTPRMALSQLNITGRGVLDATSTDHVATPKTIEFLAQLECNHDTVCWGHSFGPSVLVVLGLSYLGKNSLEQLDSCLVDWFVECAQLTDARYGVIDIADGMESGIGRWLGGSDQQYASFQRRLVRQMWAKEAGSAPKALGAYWANWLGPEMLERMGGLQQLTRETKQFADARNPQPLRVFPGGSTVFLLSSKITDFMYPRTGITWAEFDRAEWLYRRLARAGLLAGWGTAAGSC